MKPHRIRMAHQLVYEFGLHDHMSMLVSSLALSRRTRTVHSQQESLLMFVSCVIGSDHIP